MGDKEVEDLSQVAVEGGVPNACAGMSLLTICIGIPENGVWSPYGMASILSSMKSGGGADGLKNILNLKTVTISDDQLFEHFKIMANSFKSQENEQNFILKCESRYFTRNWVKILDKFAQDLKVKCDMEIVSCDFNEVEPEDPDLYVFDRKDGPAYKVINDWSLGATDGKVDYLLPKGKLDFSDIIMLNVVYFKGFWEQKFDPKDTFEGEFFLRNDRTVQVPYMRLENGQFLAGNFTSGDMKIDILSIPFKGDRLRLIIYMLDKDTKSEFKNILAVNRDFEIFIPSLLKSKVLREKKVNLTFPKFKCSTIWPYTLPFIFLSQPADFDFGPEEGTKHIYERPEDTRRFVKMNLDLQKVIIEFDEGQEGSADQSQQGVKRKAEQGDGDSSEASMEFTVNRPFFYAIADTKTDIMLIQGHCFNPLDTVYKQGDMSGPF